MFCWWCKYIIAV